MRFLIALAVAIAFAVVCKKPLKKYPVVFYAIALAFDVLFLLSTSGLMPAAVKGLSFLVVQKCTLSVAMFVVVMFVGTFPVGSAPRTYLMPIRAELSITACFLALGHICAYMATYVPVLLGGLGTTSGRNVEIALLAGFVLLVLLVVLGATSFRFVKRHMTGHGWKALQRWAYLFYALVYVHMTFMLLPSALAGGVTAQVSVAVYTLVFGVYAVARVYRFAVDHKAGRAADLGDNQFSD